MSFRRVSALVRQEAYVALVVFTDQRGGRPQPPFGLQGQRSSEDRCRQLEYLVIDDEPVEQFQMAVTRPRVIV